MGEKGLCLQAALHAVACVLHSQSKMGSTQTPFIPGFIPAWTCYIKPNQRTGAANQNNPTSHFSLVIVVAVYLLYSRAQGHLSWISPGQGEFLAAHKGTGPAPCGCNRQILGASAKQRGSVTGATRPEFSQHFYYRTWSWMQPSAEFRTTPCTKGQTTQCESSSDGAIFCQQLGVNAAWVEYPPSAPRTLPAKIFH